MQSHTSFLLACESIGLYFVGTSHLKRVGKQRPKILERSIKQEEGKDFNEDIHQLLYTGDK